MRILNFGSINIDKTYEVVSIVKEGETINSLHYEEFIGGKGLNQSIALSRAKADVYHAGKIGRDGKILKDCLVDSNVNVDFLIEADIPSGHAIIQIDKNGKNSIIVEGGSNKKITTQEIDSILSKFSSGEWILLQNEISNLNYIITKAKETNLKVALNASPIDEEISKIDLNNIDLLFINEIEGERLTGINIIDGIIAHLTNTYPKINVVLTLGHNGSMFACKGSIIKTEAISVNAVDTTGAGDTYTGFFLANYINGVSADECLKIATIASAISVTRKGASNSIPTMDEVLEFN